MQTNFLGVKKYELAKHNVLMPYFYEKLGSHLNELGLSFYKLQFLSGINNSHFSLWKRGDRIPSENDLIKISGVEELDLTYERLRYWKLLDELGGPEKAAEVLRFIEEENTK